MSTNKIFILVFIFLAFQANAQTAMKPPITPYWALGHIVWEDSVNTQAAAEKLVLLYTEHQMPVDGIIIDSPWETAYNNFDWDTKKYPQPASMLQKFQQQKVNVIMWLTGCINSTALDVPIKKHPNFDEVVAKNWCVNNGKISNWWKGDGVHIDFTNAEAKQWFYQQIDKIKHPAIKGFKVDQGEVYFGDTLQTSVGKLSNEKFRPYYYNALFEYTTKNIENGIALGRPFSFQGGYEADIDKLSLGWCGDFMGDFKGLKKQINNIYKSAEKGYGAPACELGGFTGAKSTSTELVRYAQFAATTAAMINGGENGAFSNHLPWWHSQEVNDIYKQTVWLNNALQPYKFSTLVNCHLNGGSLIQSVNYNDETHFLGKNIFTKAITNPEGSAKFTLPIEGNWFDFFENKIYAGGTNINKNYSLPTFPFFIKAGSIIPVVANEQFFKTASTTNTTVLIVDDKIVTEQLIHLPKNNGTEYTDLLVTYNGVNHTITAKANKKLAITFIIKNINEPKSIINANHWTYNKTLKQLTLVTSKNKVQIIY